MAEEQMKVKILLLDDDEEVLNMLKLFLCCLRVEVSAFSDPCAAVTYLRGNMAEIDCVMCDLVMAPLNGLGVLAETRSLSESKPFYLMSANASANDLAEAQKLNATGFIEKPMVHLQLQQIISKLPVQDNRA